jgi:cytochrome c553
MTHKIVSVVVGLVLLLFVGAALAFAWSVSARAPEMAGRRAAPAIPHPVDQATASCGQCHAVTAGTLPVTHRGFPTSSCEACHETLPTRLVPHAAATLEDKCVLCHGDPSLPLGMPASHLSYRVKRCAFCHAADPKRNLQPAAAGMSAQKAPRIKHPVTGAFATCTYCHRAGGQPSLPASHEAFGENTCRFVCHFRSAGK